jgi:hypothetical protein
VSILVLYNFSMRRLVRFFLVCFMVLATPAQGMAASLTVFCGLSHDQTTLVGIPNGPGGAAAHAAHDHPHGDSAMAPGELGQAPHHGEYGCSACAACCAALPLPSSFALPEPWRLRHGVRSTLIEPLASHHPDTPDPPPRPVFA